MCWIPAFGGNMFMADKIHPDTTHPVLYILSNATAYEYSGFFICFASFYIVFFLPLFLKKRWFYFGCGVFKYYLETDLGKTLVFCTRICMLLVLIWPSILFGLTCVGCRLITSYFHWLTLINWIKLYGLDVYIFFLDLIYFFSKRPAQTAATFVCLASVSIIFYPYYYCIY